jgi:hypothetical protein
MPYKAEVFFSSIDAAAAVVAAALNEIICFRN